MAESGRMREGSGHRRAAGLLGASLAASTGLLALYAGNPRLARSYAGVTATPCTPVTTTADSGPGSLRDSWMEIAAGTCDTITITATGTLALSSSLPELDLTTGPALAITDVTITGNPRFTVEGDGAAIAGLHVLGGTSAPYPKTLTVEGLRTDRLHTPVWAKGLQVTVTGSAFARNADRAVYVYSDTLTLEDSEVVGTRSVIPDGAVQVAGRATRTTISGSTFTDNQWGAFDGGPTAVTVSDSTFTGNGTYSPSHLFAVGAGSSYGDTKIYDSTFSGNAGYASGAWKLGVPGAGPMGGLTVADSTFAGNIGHDAGAIITFPGTFGTDISASTFHNNQSTTGGAVRAHSTAFRIANSTVTENSAVTGGGLYISSPTARIDFTTVSSNSATTAANVRAYQSDLTVKGSVFSDPRQADNCDVFLASLTGNHLVVGNPSGTDTSCGAAAANQITPVPDSEVKLGALADNGGPTRTRLPAAGSILIGEAPNGLGTGITTDQRGVARTGPFTAGSVQVPATPAPSGLRVRWAPGSVAATWSPVAGATQYRAVLSFQQPGGPVVTRTALPTRAGQSWLAFPRPRSTYLVCVRAKGVHGWSRATCGTGNPIRAGQVSGGLAAIGRGVR